MVATSLTLAAFATSAVPGLVVNGYRDVQDNDGFQTAILDTSEGDLQIRVALSDGAEAQQTAEILSLTSLTDGLRSTLGFEVPRVLGMTRAGDSRAVVTQYLDGDRFDAVDLSPESTLLESLVRALGSIHDLPATIVQQQGLPFRQASEVRADCMRLIERAQGTRYLPETVKLRWESVLQTQELWDFEPTVIHGSFGEEQVRLRNDEVAAVVGWAALSVGDPASDFAWLASDERVLNKAAAIYRAERTGATTSAFVKRASFWRELQVAKWLLHGVELRDERVIEDAVGMLDRLVDAPESPVETATASRDLGETDVIELLEQTPDATDLVSDKAAYEALDEDRTFEPDSDFTEQHSENGSGDRVD